MYIKNKVLSGSLIPNYYYNYCWFIIENIIVVIVSENVFIVIVFSFCRLFLMDNFRSVFCMLFLPGLLDLWPRHPGWALHSNITLRSIMGTARREAPESLFSWPGRIF